MSLRAQFYQKGKKFVYFIASGNVYPQEVVHLTHANDDGCCRSKSADDRFGKEIDQKAQF